MGFKQKELLPLYDEKHKIDLINLKYYFNG